VSAIFADGTGTCGQLNHTPSAAALYVQNYTDSLMATPQTCTAAWRMTLSRPPALDLTDVGIIELSTVEMTGDLLKLATCQLEMGAADYPNHQSNS